MGYVSPIPIPLGIGVVDSANVGMGNSPLPFRIGIPPTGVGSGYGPLPFRIGVLGIFEPPPEIPEVPPVVIVTAEYGAGGIVISPIEGLKPKLIGRDITADDAEVMEMILTIIGALYE